MAYWLYHILKGYKCNIGCTLSTSALCRAAKQEDEAQPGNAKPAEQNESSAAATGFAIPKQLRQMFLQAGTAGSRLSHTAFEIPFWRALCRQMSRFPRNLHLHCCMPCKELDWLASKCFRVWMRASWQAASVLGSLQKELMHRLYVLGLSLSCIIFRSWRCFLKLL